MAGISSKALGRMENAYKFNGGIELNDDLGIATYETLYRGYDAQIGRFNQIDPLADKYPDWSPYSFAFNDPVYWNDPLGSDPDLNEIINNLWNAGGGTWTAESGEYDYFNGNDASMFITGSSYMAEFGGWGQNGAANSFASAQSNYYGMGGQNPIIGQLLEPVIAIGKYNKNGQWQTTNWGDLMNQLKKNGAEGFIEGAATNIANQYERK
jgi:RHS repeat-associated protein